MAKVYSTPGVYIEEKNAFSNSVVPVATAVPCFIGYTAKAERDHQTLNGKLFKIASFDEYNRYFGGPPKVKYTVNINDPSTGKEPIEVIPEKDTQYYLYYSLKLYFDNGGGECYIYSVGNYAASGGTGSGTGGTGGGTGGTGGGAGGTGGGTGGTGGGTGGTGGGTGGTGSTPKSFSDMVDEAILALEKEPEPTMILIPDGHRVSNAAAYYNLWAKMLPHAKSMINRFAILDIYGGGDPTNIKDSTAIDGILTDYKNGVGVNDLAYGASYWPWVQAMVVSASDLNFENIENLSAVQAELKKKVKEAYPDKNGVANPKATKIEAMIDNLGVPSSTGGTGGGTGGAGGGTGGTGGGTGGAGGGTGGAGGGTGGAGGGTGGAGGGTGGAGGGTAAKITPEEISRQHNAVLQLSPLYKSVMARIKDTANILPPSGAMAGVYKAVDSSVGTHQAPANVSLISVAKPMVNINDLEQEDLNIPIDGKAINAIRAFPGKGVLVWGARTMDGNSQDWRYISVRRTVSMIELSIKYAAEVFVFEPNNSSTWSNLKAMISNFLNNMWYAGALAGATPEASYSVDVGLGSTMTPVDILDGYMRISVKVAVTRPAEFIVITFEQQMQTS